MSHSVCEVRSNTDVSRGRGQNRYECDINYIVYIFMMTYGMSERVALFRPRVTILNRSHITILYYMINKVNATTSHTEVKLFENSRHGFLSYTQ